MVYLSAFGCFLWCMYVNICKQTIHGMDPIGISYPTKVRYFSKKKRAPSLLQVSPIVSGRLRRTRNIQQPNVVSRILNRSKLVWRRSNPGEQPKVEPNMCWLKKSSQGMTTKKIHKNYTTAIVLVETWGVGTLPLTWLVIHGSWK